MQQSRSRRWGAIAGVIALCAVVAAVGLTATSWMGSSPPQAEAADGDVAKVDPIAGYDVSRVTLNPEATTRLGIQTRAARETPIDGKSRLVIPYAAVLYDPTGATWTYTSPEPNVFVREKVDVETIRGDLAVLKSGPSASTLVVTVGATELYGTEVGVGGDE